MDDVDRLHVRLPPLPICPSCGVIAPAQRSSCALCNVDFAHPRVSVPQVGAHLWVAVRCSFQCRSCQFLSPLDELDIDGRVECAHCGQAQRFDVGAWTGALAFAHGVGDLAFPPPEGRHPHAGVWIGGDNPHAAVGNTEAFDELRQSSVQVSDGLTVHRSLFLEAGPGHPVCGGCRRPLEVQLGGDGTEARCRECGEDARFELPGGADRYCSTLIGVVADAHRTDRRRARLETTADGPISLKCPDCGGALPATKERVVSCSFCGIASLIPVQARVRESGEVLVPDVWWLAFRGPSSRRQGVEIPPEPDEKEPKGRAAKKKAAMTDLDLSEEIPGPYWPQRLLNLALPTAALVVAVLLWLLLKDVLPEIPASP